MHNNCFKAFLIPSCYTKTELKDGKKLKKTIFDLKIKGANITIPYKEEAYKICDVLDTNAKTIGAVNTIVNNNGKLHGYNTDSTGFVKSISEYKDVKSILILGAGGTARAISVALKNEGYNIEILNRSQNRLEFFKSLGVDTNSHDSFKTNKNYDMVVNTTSAGLLENSLPFDRDKLTNILQNSKYAIDVMYGKITPFLTLANELGKITKDGEDMLLYQGVLAFDYFTQHKFNTDDIQKYMREGLKS